MSHQIEENDLTYSISGTEWHGLAIHRPDGFSTDDENSICDSILVEVEPSYALPDGTLIASGDGKGLFAH